MPAVFGLGLVLPVVLFNQRLPGYFVLSNNGRWIQSDTDEFMVSRLGLIKLYYNSESSHVFITTTNAMIAHYYDPGVNVQIPHVTQHFQIAHTWFKRYFPEEFPQFGLKLFDIPDTF
jgi:hypothetical protein